MIALSASVFMLASSSNAFFFFNVEMFSKGDNEYFRSQGYFISGIVNLAAQYKDDENQAGT